MPGIGASSSARKRALRWSSLEPLGHLLECDQSRCRQHAGLPHPAAEPLAIEARRGRSPPQCPPACEPTGAHRPFDRQNITVSAPAASSFTFLPRQAAALKIARAVQMHLQPQFVGPVADFVRDLHRRDRSAGHVVRVLESR